MVLLKHGVHCFPVSLCSEGPGWFRGPAKAMQRVSFDISTQMAPPTTSAGCEEKYPPRGGGANSAARGPKLHTSRSILHHPCRERSRSKGLIGSVGKHQPHTFRSKESKGRLVLQTSEFASLEGKALLTARHNLEPKRFPVSPMVESISFQGSNSRTFIEEYTAHSQFA